jgi:predicted nucleic acid-binding protein
VNVVVVDASVGVKWVIAEPGFEEARRLRARHSFVTPELFMTETANTLWKKARNRELTIAEATLAHRILMLAPIEVRPMGPPIASALQLALDLAHPVYDCIYLALAVAEGIPIVTADARLARKLAGGALPPVILVGSPTP